MKEDSIYLPDKFDRIELIKQNSKNLKCPIKSTDINNNNTKNKIRKHYFVKTVP